MGASRSVSLWLGNVAVYIFLLVSLGKIAHHDSKVNEQRQWIKIMEKKKFSTYIMVGFGIKGKCQKSHILKEPKGSKSFALPGSSGHK